MSRYNGLTSGIPRNAILAVAIIFVIAAIANFLMGYFAVKASEDYGIVPNSTSRVESGATLLITIGVFYAMAAALALYVTKKKHPVGVPLCFIVVLVILVTFGMGASVTLIVGRNHAKNRVSYGGLQPFFSDYTGEEKDVNSENVDNLQKKLECCGVGDLNDWKNSTVTPNWVTRSRWPNSCCKQDVDICNRIEEKYDYGCLEALSDWLGYTLDWIAGICIANTMLLILGIFGSCMIMCLRDGHENA